jgi:hypothetical protein
VGAPGRPCGAQEQQDQLQDIRRKPPMPLRIAYRTVLRISDISINYYGRIQKALYLISLHETKDVSIDVSQV